MKYFVKQIKDLKNNKNNMNKEQSVFQKLSAINVNDKIEKKNGLSYVSWIFAWSEVKKVYPSANYRVVNFDGKPYLFDEHLGYLVQTEVTIEGETIPMQLPVMDNMNRAQRHIVYQKFNKDIQPATMFDINTAIMRCLTKNLAMFGLGSYIYAGEDLPMVETEVDLSAIQTKVDSCTTLDELQMLYDVLEPSEKSKAKALFTKKRIQING
jgi:hypothetical protein